MTTPANLLGLLLLRLLRLLPSPTSSTTFLRLFLLFLTRLFLSLLPCWTPRSDARLALS
jgi:hypothetical protein